MNLQEHKQAIVQHIRTAKEQEIFPYFKPIARSWGPEVEVDGRRLVMAGSNDYLGLTHDPRVIEATTEAVKRWGTGPGGSRFLSGNMTLHEELEERLADFVGKKGAVVHTTGFLANHGAISCLVSPRDMILCDKEDHASIFEGCRASGARIVSFAHNDASSAGKRLKNYLAKYSDASIFIITEGVFSMSGDVCILPQLLELKKDNPDLLIYLDDAHGLGVMGQSGRGTANHFGVAEDVDFIMGTFSKALASIGGFIATDDMDILTYLKHQSKTLIFSAALPAGNAASVFKGLDILEKEPERVEKLWEITAKVRKGYHDIGLYTGTSESPIIPIHIGNEEKAYLFASALFQNGVFALPAVYPAVPKGRAVIRTAFMSTHEDKHIDFVLDVMNKLAAEYGVRIQDAETEEPYLAAASASNNM